MKTSNNITFFNRDIKSSAFKIDIFCLGNIGFNTRFVTFFQIEFCQYSRILFKSFDGKIAESILSLLKLKLKLRCFLMSIATLNSNNVLYQQPIREYCHYFKACFWLVPSKYDDAFWIFIPRIKGWVFYPFLAPFLKLWFFT